ncbi:MAG: tRNA pseudouridine(38-40) synthase TruA [Bryobacterales bacterium]|nr:tRNA pseudouridine(38-40) synthase TruA [Bryobacterales bacterium]
MRRIRITVAYDGAVYHGWQVQPGLATIQGALETALEQIEGRPVDVAGSGRTDAGVHALAQVAAFSIANPIPPGNLKKALNRLLPGEIRVLALEEAAADFHPRFQALARTYEYRIWRGEVVPPFERRYVYHFPYPIDEERFIEAASVFAGEHDFSAFAASDERDALGGSKVRTFFQSRAWREGDRLLYRVRGSGFLKHMVRNIVGTLIEAGKGNLTPDHIRALLRPGVEGKAGPSAPARGLFLVGVDYS